MDVMLALLDCMGHASALNLLALFTLCTALGGLTGSFRGCIPFDSKRLGKAGHLPSNGGGGCFKSSQTGHR